jgi:hypothetical protein
VGSFTRGGPFWIGSGGILTTGEAVGASPAAIRLSQTGHQGQLYVVLMLKMEQF